MQTRANGLKRHVCELILDCDPDILVFGISTRKRTKKEKEENIRKRKILGRGKYFLFWEKKNRESIWSRKILVVSGGEGKRGKYLENKKGTGCYLVVLGQKRAVLVDTWWYWNRIGRYWLIYNSTESVWSRTG